MHQLQHLHGELHVAKTSAAQLDLTVAQWHWDEALHTFAHALAVGDEVLAPRGLPDEFGCHLHVCLAKRHVTGHSPCLEQCLELPALRPLPVVGLMRVQTAHQRTVLAFGSQCPIDLPQCGLHHIGHHRLADLLHEHGDLRTDLDQLRLRHGLGHRLHHVDEIDIGDVVELLCAELAHANDCEAQEFGLLRVALRNGQRAFQGGVRQIRQRAGHRRLNRDRVVVRNIVGHDRSQLFVIVPS